MSPYIRRRCRSYEQACKDTGRDPIVERAIETLVARMMGEFGQTKAQAMEEAEVPQ